MGYCIESQMDPRHQRYHDEEYGFPIADDNRLFERFVLEINQAGLSWSTILRKQENFRAAYAGFDIQKVAHFDENDRMRLLGDTGIIRNRLKVNAAITNAQRILLLRQECGSFKAWLDAHHPRSKAAWVQLFKAHFVFVGGEIVGEFLMSTGYLPGAHEENCPVYAHILTLNPPWAQGEGGSMGETAL